MGSYGGNEGGVEFNDVENVELICKQLRQHFREMCWFVCWVRMRGARGVAVAECYCVLISRYFHRQLLGAKSRDCHRISMLKALPLILAWLHFDLLASFV